MQVKGTEVFIGQQGGLQKGSIHVPVRPDNPCEGAEQDGGELGMGDLWGRTAPPQSLAFLQPGVVFLQSLQSGLLLLQGSLSQPLTLLLIPHTILKGPC